MRGLPDRLIAHLRLLEGDYGGFPVDRWTIRCRPPRDSATVATTSTSSALLHDIGDTLGPFNHFDVAAAILKPVVGEANLWMVQTTASSRATTSSTHLGMDRNLRDQFEGHPHYERTAEFCALYDNPAFDPNARRCRSTEFEPMLRRVFAQPRNSIYQAAVTAAQ